MKEFKDTLEKRLREYQVLDSIKNRINAGLTLDQVLAYAFEAFQEIIPYNRIGLALLDEKGTMVRAHWSRSDSSQVKLENSYSAPLKGSSLEQIIKTGNPRILNDLEAYLREHPESISTRKIVEEGMRSSLTCPLFIEGKPIGFLFFSSMQPHAYQDIHVGFFQEIANQVSLIIEKGRLYQRLAELNELKNKLLGIAAHDLRNPIGIIKGFSEFIRDGAFGDVTEKQKKYLHRIIDNCETMLELINDLLEISAIESGKLELNFREMDLKPYIEEFYEYGRIMAQRKGIELVLEMPPDPPKVIFDPERINQVLNNLLTNAIKYSYPDTTIRITIQMKGENLEVSVQDEGQGIPEEEIPRLFTDYGRGSARPTAGEKSTGLGLAIVKRIVEAHEGIVSVRSAPGKGSCFTFTLPGKGPRKTKQSFSLG